MLSEYVLRNSMKMEETRTFSLKSNVSSNSAPTLAVASLCATGGLSTSAPALPLKILRRDPNGLITVLWGDEIITGLIKCAGERRDQLEIVLGEHSYSLVLREAAIDTMEQALSSSAHASGKIEINSPIPGLVKALNVKVGDAVEAGQTLLVLEAMKMENEISASANGIITAIHVIAAQTVAAGTILITLEK